MFFKETKKCKSPEAGLNHRPFAYKANALPLSYGGDIIINILIIKNK